MPRSEQLGIEENEQMIANANYQHWQEYNARNRRGVILKSHGENSTYSSYTQYFFNKWNLSVYLNNTCQSILQLGVASGKFLMEYKAKEWAVKGYDYSEESIRYLENNNISVRKVDLNGIESQKETLSYQDMLIEDLSLPTNFLAIRVLQYLNLDAITLLLHALQDHLKKDSVIFLVGKVEPKEEMELAEANIAHKKPMLNPLERNYIASFFAPRTDFTILLHTTTDSEKEFLPSDHLDEVIVLKKI